MAADRLRRQRREIEQIGPGTALTIGLSQALALLPGISRSGATISAGLALGLTRESAARFSFLLATPITLGAGLYGSRHLLDEAHTGHRMAGHRRGIRCRGHRRAAGNRLPAGVAARRSFLVFGVYRRGVGRAGRGARHGRPLSVAGRSNPALTPHGARPTMPRRRTLRSGRSAGRATWPRPASGTRANGLAAWSVFC